MSSIRVSVSGQLMSLQLLTVWLPENVLHKLQKLQNAAARIDWHIQIDHVTPVLKKLHWLPVASRIEYKIGLLTYKCLHTEVYV